MIFFIASRSSLTFASQLITIAVGWQMYSITKSTLYLGLVGLMQFIPMLLITLAAGYAADHLNRKAIAFFCAFCLCLLYLCLAFSSYFGAITKTILLSAAFIIGAVNALNGPSMHSILPGIFEKAKFTKAVAINTSSMQAATIIGPAAGGLLYAAGASVVYFAAAAFAGAATFLIAAADSTTVASRPRSATGVCALS